MDDHRDTKIWTYDDLVALDTDPQVRHEIIDGELVVSPSPSFVHQRVAMNLTQMLGRALEATGLATVIAQPFDVILSSTRVAIPDAVVVSRARHHLIKAHAIVGAPDLVVEVVSPGGSKYDRVRKRGFYARGKVPEYWIVDPQDGSVDVLALIEEGLSYRSAGFYAAGDRVKSEVFPTIDFSVDDIFTVPELDDSDLA